MNGWIYIMSEDSGWYKIGCSCDVERRLKKLLKFNGDLWVVEKYECKTMYKTEKMIHKYLYSINVCRKGEFFKFDLDFLKKIVMDGVAGKLIINS
jgi:hypothetical protein